MKRLIRGIKRLMSNEWIDFTVKMTIITILSLLWVSIAEAQRIDKNLQPYLDSYTELLADNDIKMPNNGYVIVYNSKMLVTPYLGVALGMYVPNFVYIRVNPNFTELSENQRVWIMYHELTHDIFNIEHNEIELMARHVPMYVDAILLSRAKRGLVKYLKEGYDWNRLLENRNELRGS